MKHVNQLNLSASNASKLQTMLKSVKAGDMLVEHTIKVSATSKVITKVQVFVDPIYIKGSKRNVHKVTTTTTIEKVELDGQDFEKPPVTEEHIQTIEI